MTIFDRVKAAARAFRGKGATSVELNQLLDFLGIDKDSLPNSAMAEATYFACCKVLSEAVAKLPLKLQQATPGQGIRVAREHPYYRMLNERPNKHMTATVFWGTMELCRLHYGNAYAWIDTRDPRHPQLWPIDPATVQVWYDDACEVFDAPDVFYVVQTKKGVRPYRSSEMLHFKSHLTLDGLVGVPVREQLASTVESGIKSQAVINSMYDTGMTAKAVLNYTGDINDASVKKLVRKVKEYLTSSADAETGLMLPLPQGFSLTPLTLKLADNQFLEVRQYTALQIAAAFGVKPYQIGDYTKSSYASAEAQQLAFLVDTLLTPLKQYEEEIGYKLLTDAEEAAGYHAKFNTGVLLRADQKTQIETLSKAVSSFLLTPNEAREMLDRPAKEGGDQLLGNGASIPVQYTGAQYMDLSGKEEKAWLEKTIREAVRSVLE